MVIAEKQNLLTDQRHQRILESLNRLFGPRFSRPRSELNSESLRSMDLSRMERDMATDSSVFHSLFQNRLFHSILGNISPRRSYTNSKAESLHSRNRYISQQLITQSNSPHKLNNKPNPDVHIVPITIIDDKEKSESDKTCSEADTPLHNKELLHQKRSISSVSEKDISCDIPVIVIPGDCSDDDPLDNEPPIVEAASCDIGEASLTQLENSKSNDVIIVDKPKSVSVREDVDKNSGKIFRSNKDTLVGGANKIHADMGPDVYFTSESMDIPAGASYLTAKHGASGASHGQYSSSSVEKPVNDVPDHPIYSFLKTKLMKECRQIDHIKGDGNCFFRALSKQLYGSEGYHIILRNLIVDLVATNKNKFSQFVDGGDVQDHVERMSQEQSWATTCEIYAAATLLQRDIFMLTPDHLNETYSWLLFKPVFKLDPEQSNLESHPCYITLCNTNGNHYDRIVGEHGGCNCFLPHPELEGISYNVDLT